MGTNINIGGTKYTNISTIRIPLADESGNAIYEFARLETSREEAEYLENTIKALLNTDKVFTYPSNDYELYMKFSVTNVSSTYLLCGSGHTHNTLSNDQLVVQNGKLRIDRVGTTTYSSSLVANQIYEYSEKDGVISFDGNYYQSAVKDSAIVKAFSLFGETTKGQTAETGVKIYEFYYKENGQEIIHLHPIVDSNGVTCLYDTVSKEAFYIPTN